MELLGEGSVKTLYWDPKYPDLIRLSFSDRVSVFDYGALPESIPEKGKALERSAIAFFDILEEKGLATAYAREATQKENKGLYLRAAQGGKFLKDQKSPLQFIPLEVIFRWGVPDGSSLIRRGYTRGEQFETPLIEFTTKLESSDRLLEADEAQFLAGGDQRFFALQQYATQVAIVIRDALKQMGLHLWDGKIECAWNEDTEEIVLVDSLGPDELRVTLPGLDRVPLSKELLRRWLSETSWSFAIKKAKESSEGDWKKNLALPPRLGEWRVDRFAGLYQAFAQSLEARKSEPIWNWLRNENIKPKVMVLGGGGREAALRWRLSLEGCEFVQDSKEADAVLVSMDSDLANAKVNELSRDRVWTFGPTREASQIEWSKLFGREIARKAGLKIPFVSEDLEAFPPEALPVLKKDGLAAGKGVLVPQNRDELLDVYEQWKEESSKILFEERCSGPEASAFFSVSSGYYGLKVRFLGTAQDFKRRFAGDEGPNTGGMGAYAPHEIFTPDDVEQMRIWATATAHVLAQRGISYHGIVYLGLMKDPEKGWVLLEYNARFGDPETQALVMMWPREKQILRTLLGLSIDDSEFSSDQDESIVCLALVRPEYPSPAPRDFQLAPWDFKSTENVNLFRSESQGGRVAYLVAKAKSRIEAGDHLFQALVESPWKDSLDWRRDILP